jgi:hypothetical protein
MHRLWPTDAIPGEALQLLPLPRHFSQVGGERESFFEFYAGQVLPRLRAGWRGKHRTVSAGPRQ